MPRIVADLAKDTPERDTLAAGIAKIMPLRPARVIIDMKTVRPKLLLRIAIVLTVLMVACEAQAHISHKSPYRQGVHETIWALTAAIIFGIGQLAGLAYLSAIMTAYRRRLFGKNLGLATVVQLVIAVLFFCASAITYFICAGFTKDLHLATHPFELATVVRHEITGQLIFANLITFALCVGLSWLLLLLFRPLRKTWTVPFVLTLVFHPLVFPVGIVVGVIHAIYVYRIGPPQRVAED